MFVKMMHILVIIQMILKILVYSRNEYKPTDNLNI